MTGREFFNRISNSNKDFIQEFIDILRDRKIKFCIIDGLAVNVYAEPVISLDVDIVIISEKLRELLDILQKNFKVKRFEHSINISSPCSDIRIQIQTDEKYQEFINRAKLRPVLGYKLPVACIRDVLMGKIWAYSDKTRRASKRQKDLADIVRILEVKPGLFNLLPGELRKQLKFRVNEYK